MKVAHLLFLASLVTTGNVWGQVERAKSVSFNVEALPNESGSEQAVWRASYGDREAFTIFLQPEQHKGTIRHVAGFEPAEFLEKLKSALRATNTAHPKRHVDTLSFDVVVLGTDMVRFESGTFINRPGGHWIVTKIFLGKDGDGEVFLNLDPVAGVGEFSLKDEEYGNTILDALASVL